MSEITWPASPKVAHLRDSEWIEGNIKNKVECPDCGDRFYHRLDAQKQVDALHRDGRGFCPSCTTELVIATSHFEPEDLL